MLNKNPLDRSITIFYKLKETYLHFNTNNMLYLYNIQYIYFNIMCFKESLYM